MQDDTMTWAEISARLAAARTYWLGTTTTSGGPHAAPVWGVPRRSVAGLPDRPRVIQPVADPAVVTGEPPTG
jgi:hypothetical protein